MSRYYYSDTTDRIYFKKDANTAKELIIVEDACDRLNDLERQLAEAKRKNKSLEKLIEGIILGSTEARDLLNQTFVNYNEKLKEKGDQ